MPKGLSCKAALEQWKKKHAGSESEDFGHGDPTKARVVKLNCMRPSIDKMDSSTLSSLTECEHLSLSMNQIDKISTLPGCASLRVLSLGRNNIKKIEKLEEVASTLEELWMSYNQIDKLSGLENLTRLSTLYLSNNKISDFAELDRIAHLTQLKDLLFTGNPIQTTAPDTQTYRDSVIRRLPGLKNWKLDGVLVTADEIANAMAAAE